VVAVAGVAAVAAAAGASATRPAGPTLETMGRVSPRRALIGAAALVWGCAAKHHAPPLAVPELQNEKVSVRVVAARPIGPVQPVAVAVTNGLGESVRVDPRQAYATNPSGERIAPLPPGEAARLGKGRPLPGSLRGAGKGVVTGGLLGAVGGAIGGAITGGIGTAVAAGAAVGAALGGITGAIGGGGEPPPDVAGYAERGLPSTSLAPGLSATGYVYYPEGRYETLELLLSEEPSGRTLAERSSIAPAE